VESAADEAELLAQVAEGDHGPPLVALYRHYHGSLYALGLRLLGDRGLAEELVQETFVRLWRTADRFDPARGSVRSYVFTMARRIAIDLWRRPSSRPFEAPVDAEAVGGAGIDEMLSGLVVREALDSLSPAHREVLELSYDQDLRQADIAARLGLPLGTVKTRSYYALRALRLALEERGWRA